LLILSSDCFHSGASRGKIGGLQTLISFPRKRTVPLVAGGLLLLAGALTIVGWEIGVSFVNYPFSTLVMPPNTAVCLIAAGMALIVEQWGAHWFWRGLRATLGGFVTLAGLLILAEYLLRADFGIDRLLLASRLSRWTTIELPGRFAPNTAVALSFAGLALLLPKARAGIFRLGELLALPVFFISFLSLVGYTYRAEPLYGFSSFSPMALQTALCLGILALGLLWPNNNHGVMALVLSHDAGGVAARRLLIATFVTLPLLGFLLVKAHAHSWLEVRFGTAVLIIVSVVVFAALIIQTAFVLRELDAQRRQAQESLLRSHSELEALVDQRTAALRHLSTRLMQLQDNERRRIARELHDGLGQYLSALAINLGRLDQDSPHPVLTECRELLDQTISEVRTLSHLLHPPLLDEVGFASAAKWYVEEFAKRSGIEATVDLPDRLPRLPEAVEIGLFRALQEGLTNIHRHSSSPKAEVHMETAPGKLSLDIIDYGTGIPPQVLERWRNTGTAGVGMTGMRERIKELGGQVEISSSGTGTLVRVTVPVLEAASADAGSAA
jgi:signal transduction histidine kinase